MQLLISVAPELVLTRKKEQSEHCFCAIVRGSERKKTVCVLTNAVLRPFHEPLGGDARGTPGSVGVHTRAGVIADAFVDKREYARLEVHRDWKD